MPVLSTGPFTISDLHPIDEAGHAAIWLREGASAEEAELVAACAEWTSTYPTRKVRKGRRIEALCPMVKPSMEDRSLILAAVFGQGREPALVTLDALLRNAADRFQSEIKSSDPRLRCLTLVLPGVRGARLLEATEPDRAIKGELLKRGILVGEFFPSCPFATTFNPRFFALRSPAPMYVFRTLLDSDWRFICQIPEWQAIYRERFGEPPRRLCHLGGRAWRWKQKIQWRLDALRQRFGRGEEENPFIES